MFSFFESLSEHTQLAIVIIALALLYAFVLANNKRNKKKQYNRKKRDFKANYFKRKEKR